MNKKRVVITGMGVVSCHGNNVDQFYEKLLNGESGISMIEGFECSDYPTRFAGEIKNFNVGDYMAPKMARRLDPFIQYAQVAGKKALEMSQLNLESEDRKRIGVIIGSGMGGMGVFFDGSNTITQKGFKRLTPFFVPAIITDMAGAYLALDLGLHGPNYSISTACATANYSILSAYEQIQLGNADVMLCGGTEAPMNPTGLAGFTASKAISTRNDSIVTASRPWDKDRDGFVIGEGSGVLVIETLEHALNRGATIYAELKGGFSNCDAYHMTDPRPDGSIVADCIEGAILSAGLVKEDINYINAHATSTVAGDIAELKAIKSVFKDHSSKVRINGTKSLIGHCLGAAGGLEAVATIKAIQTSKLHPTINVENPVEELTGLNPVLDKAESCDVTAALSTSFGFGGHNSCIVFTPYKD
ncbi:MAG TPA: beta-ketoacyl-ACP synthase II [Chlamydiales bacterium]|nr:beta-ketoacyl-ACP synthase II [Chlamydiales bacterium]